MAITIRAPEPAPAARNFLSHPHNDEYDSDSDSSGGVDLDGDVSMEIAARRQRSHASTGLDEIVTPGEEITSDPQWMRFVNLDQSFSQSHSKTHH